MTYPNFIGLGPRSKDLTGQKINSFTARGIINYTPAPRISAIWLWQCECGNTIQRTRNRLPQSCGCKLHQSQSEIGKRNLKHGLSTHPLYWKLRRMMQRCEDKGCDDYAYYGAKGITVCEQWRSDPRVFVQWAVSTGYVPGLTIDRIDPTKGYYPDNCRWLTHSNNCKKGRYGSN